MILLLDFDGTLFHTEAFKENAGFAHVSCIENPRYCLEVLSRQGSIEKFLFEDTMSFLKDHARHDLMLITFGDPEFQKAKVTQSGIFHLFKKPIFTGNEMKGEVAGRLFPDEGETIIFLDDDLDQLKSMKDRCSHIIPVRMRREGVILWNDIDQNDFPEVSNLSQFAALINTF